MQKSRIIALFTRWFGYDRLTSSNLTLKEWRELAFEIILNVSLPVATIAYLWNLSSLILRGEWLIAAGDTVAYLLLVVIRFTGHKLPYRLRVYSILFLMVSLGLFLGITKPTFGDGRLWLMISAVVAAIMLGGRAGVIIVLLISFSWFGLGILFRTGILLYPYEYILQFISPDNTFWWANTAVVLFGIGMIIAISIDVIIRNLSNALKESRSLTDQLVREIEAKQKTELALEYSQQRYSSLISNSPQLFMEIDLDLRIKAINPAMKRSLGFLNESLEGVHVSEVLPDDTLNKRLAWFEKGIAENKPIHFEDQRGGRYFYNILVPNLEKGSFQVIALDITERVLAQKKLETHQKELEEIVRIRTQKLEQEMRERKKIERTALASQKMADIGLLTTGIAHEMNSPLQGIMITSDYLLMNLDKGNLDADTFEERLNIIKMNVRRCASIVDALRFYAHETPGELSPYDLDELIQSTIMLIRHQFRSASNITFETDLAEDMPAFYCDRDRMMQVFINILTNSRDAMPDGGKITIEAKYLDGKKEFLIRVTDTGHGIPGDIKDQIYVPFFTTKPVGKGTGLGLYIVSGIVRSRGGNIEMISEPGSGTTCVLTFPKEPINNTVSSILQGRLG